MAAALARRFDWATLISNMRRRKYTIAIAAIGALIVVGVTAFWLSSSLPAPGGAVPIECTVETTPREPCDLDCDGDCDRDDEDIFHDSIHMCSYNPPRPQLKYNPLADANGDECVDVTDLLLLFPDVYRVGPKVPYPETEIPKY